MDEPREPFDFGARDPDWDDVPPDLAALDGEAVKVEAPTDLAGEGASGTLVVCPELFAHARRRREDRERYDPGAG
jgi:hypothetical protein